MSRTTLCVVTAAVLASISVAWMLTRRVVLGPEVKLPAGPDTWKVTLVAQGKTTGSARLITAVPLDFGRQHIVSESYRSEELTAKPAEDRNPAQRLILWSSRPGAPAGPFRARYEFYCQVLVKEPTASMSALNRRLYAPPQAGDQLQNEAGIDRDHADIGALARRLTARLDKPVDQAEALYQYVARAIDNEPAVPGPAIGAMECLQDGSGDSGGKSRLLVALCRNRGIPARLVTGLALTNGPEQTAHVWVEAWLRDQWQPMCPFYRHFGKVPPTFLVFGYGDLAPARGRNAKGLSYAYLVERQPALGSADRAEQSWLRRTLAAVSLHELPPAEKRLAEFLLLLPIAALVICVFRNLIGLHSFGTFAPALLGLAFREAGSWPGIFIFVAIILIGWGLRRVLDRYHLLQVPRIALLLSLVVIVLLTAIVAANQHSLLATQYISLFPLVILTGMIERFWTLETEDGATASFRTLLNTILVAGTIAVVLSLHAVPGQMVRYPETLGLIMAAQLLIGRYTGYRLSELYRFRDFLRMRNAECGMRNDEQRRAA